MLTEFEITLIFSSEKWNVWQNYRTFPGRTFFCRTSLPCTGELIMCDHPIILCQRQFYSTKFSSSIHWKWPRLADDDLPPLSGKNKQAKTHKTKVWPRKAERSQGVGNLPSYDRWQVCTSQHQAMLAKSSNVTHSSHLKFSNVNAQTRLSNFFFFFFFWEM